MFLQAFLYLLCGVSRFHNERLPIKNNKISVELRLHPKELKDSGKIVFQSAEYILSPKTNSEFKRPRNGSLQIEMTSEEPLYLNFIDVLRASKSGFYLAEPGDDVVITSNGDGFCFSGKGAEKYRFQYQLDSMAKSVPNNNKKTGTAIFYLDSFDEYFEWTHYYQQKINLALPLMNFYKGKVSSWAFSIIADNYIRSAVKNMRSQFYSLVENGISHKKVPGESLVKIYDSSFSKYTKEWIGHATNKKLIALELNAQQLQRAYSFDSQKMPNSNEITLIQLEDILNVYTGQELESLIVNRLPKAMIKIGFTPAMEKLLARYYAISAYPEWKKWIKEQEVIARVGWLSYKAADFTLTDEGGKLITNNDLKGKIAVLCFQNVTGSKEKTDIPILKKAVEKYKNRRDVVFVNIFIKKNSIVNRNSLPAKNDINNVINARTIGIGVSNPILRDYAIESWPWVWVIDSTGKVINANPKINLATGKTDILAAFIQKKMDDDNAFYQKEISFKKDGPYIFHADNGATSYSIDDSILTKSIIDKKTQQQFVVQTDLEKTFNVYLQSQIVIQPSVYPAAEKLLAFSDIEGNFDAFRKLLQSNKVIDDNFNWIFGSGHLVFAGDMFDRGNQVTECLWLMYSLEEKAKAAGGYVHFILGNHEIMNMQGNHYYTTKKYKKNAALIGKTLTELYNENSEIGRWLRSKNIIEKIGDLLFVHGGISPELNRLPLGIVEINDLARPYYGRRIDSANNTIMTLYDTRYGERYRISPFWSRGYYKSRTIKGIDKVSNEQLDTTFNKFSVRRIVTGHTIVADTISVHYGGRVINTDTRHAKGFSEALLIEDSRYYRVNSRGERVLLFIDDRVERN